MSGYLRRLAERAVCRADGATRISATADPFEATAYDPAWPATAVTPQAASTEPGENTVGDYEAQTIAPERREIVQPVAPTAPLTPASDAPRVHQTVEWREIATIQPPAQSPGQPRIAAQGETPEPRESREVVDVRPSAPSPPFEPAPPVPAHDLRTVVEMQASAIRPLEPAVPLEPARSIETRTEIVQRVEPAAVHMLEGRPAHEPETSLVIHRMQVDVIATRPEAAATGRRAGRAATGVATSRSSRVRTGAPPAAFGLRQM